MADRDWGVAAGVLRLSAQLVDGVQQGLAARGFDDVRPAHGFAFSRIAAGDATTVELAEHLGVTKQAASQLVQQLVDRGYVSREPDPRDARARRLALTERGRACTEAAEAAAADTVAAWRATVGERRFAGFEDVVHAVATPGRLRSSW